jgi:hypothetical protein
MEGVQIIDARAKTAAADPGKPSAVRAVEEVTLIYKKIDWIEGASSRQFFSIEFPTVIAEREMMNERQAGS